MARLCVSGSVLIVPMLNVSLKSPFLSFTQCVQKVIKDFQGGS